MSAHPPALRLKMKIAAASAAPAITSGVDSSESQRLYIIPTMQCVVLFGVGGGVVLICAV